MPQGMSCITTATATANKYAATSLTTETVPQTSTYCLCCVQLDFTITEGSDNSHQERPPKLQVSMWVLSEDICKLQH